MNLHSEKMFVKQDLSGTELPFGAIQRTQTSKLQLCMCCGGDDGIF